MHLAGLLSILFPVSVLSLCILLLIFLLKRLHQPYLIAYILAGVLLGPHVSGIFTDAGNIAALGQIGIVLLLFFLGMEIEIPGRHSLLLKPIIAQFMKTLLSVVFSLLVGKWMGWGSGSIVLLIVTLMFNSTAVVSSYLKKNGELHTALGGTMLNMLLLQDVLLAPVLTAFQLIGHQSPDYGKLVISATGCVLMFLFLRSMRRRTLFKWPFAKEMEQDHDLQVFTGACICLGFAWVAGMFGLTESLGSFVAGMYIGRTHSFHWLEKALQPFKIFFVALFFVSIGLMLDIGYLKTHSTIVLVVTLLVIVINSLLSAVVFRLLHHNWRDSLYAGALLSQTGEFSLLACSLAYEMKIIDMDVFKLTVTVVCFSLLLSTVWVSLLKKFIYRGRLALGVWA